MKRLTFLLSALLLAIFSGNAGAASPAPAQLLQRFVDGLHSLTADFEQHQYDDEGNELAFRSGTVALLRPGRFDWRYDKPYVQRIVCDGKTIWNYEPDLAQVTTSEAGPVLKETPAALLAQADALEQQFDLEYGGIDGDQEVLRLKPKNGNTDFSLIELWLDGSGVPHRMRFHDPLGGVSDVRFDHLQIDPKLDQTHFHFDPPQGVDVVNLEAPAE